MEVLQNLFNELGDVVSSLEQIGITFTTPLADFLAETPVLNGLVSIGIFDPLLDFFPDITLFGLMFSSGLAFVIVYSLVKWFLDIVL